MGFLMKWFLQSAFYKYLRILIIVHFFSKILLLCIFLISQTLVNQLNVATDGDCKIILLSDNGFKGNLKFSTNDYTL